MIKKIEAAEVYELVKGADCIHTSERIRKTPPSEVFHDPFDARIVTIQAMFLIRREDFDG